MACTLIETGNNDAEIPRGSYDAIRVYLWAGMIDRTGAVRAQVLSAIPAMNVYLANHDAPPQMVSDQGIPLAQDGPVGFSPPCCLTSEPSPAPPGPAPGRWSVSAGCATRPRDYMERTRHITVSALPCSQPALSTADSGSVRVEN